MPSKTRFKSGLKINVSRQRTVIKSRLEVKSEYLNFGARAEALTRSEGERRGLKWVASNVRYRAGELDVVMIDFARREWVFVEVRARRSRDWRSPLEWVSVPKILKLRRAIAIYLEGPEARAWTAQMHLSEKWGRVPLKKKTGSSELPVLNGSKILVRFENSVTLEGSAGSEISIR
jgi:Holliday junction resolvase-like predicted endonuclease